MMTEPDAIPKTVPEIGPADVTVATAVLLLLHTPPVYVDAESVNVMVDPTHTTDGPTSVPTPEPLIETVVVVIHPPGKL
jgi:hypothetical protein